MAFLLLLASAVTLSLIAISSFVMRHLQPSLNVKAANKDDDLDLSEGCTEPSKVIKSLIAALPDSIILPQNVSAFKQSMNSYWAQQECEVVPAGVVRPRDVHQLSTAITILKHEYDEREGPNSPQDSVGIFAVRSGGHCPVPGAASIKGGVLIDLSHFREVTPSEDGTSVVIGAGAKWIDVSTILEEKSLAVVGGRNCAVGVGGLTLGGGLSFFSPRFGLVCCNIISYEIVLASGSVTTASASTNPDLWRALKGGSSNFGIVTRFTARSFPSGNIWSGFLYMPSYQATKVIAVFHDFVNRADSGDPTTSYDVHAAGPMACFSYIQALRIQVVTVSLVHTKPPENEKQWPACWRSSGFASLWRLWSTCKIRTLTSATDEMNALNPPGRRQVFAATTVKNDPATLAAAHVAYCDAIAPLRRANPRGLVWTLVLQPLLPEWVRKGDPNPLGLHDIDEPLVIVSFTVNWDERKDDEFVKATTRRTIELIEAAAVANKTSHRWRYLNYCAEWQRPFEGYGEENLRFLQGVSRKYDPDGLFQKGCVGGFKLGMVESKS